MKKKKKTSSVVCEMLKKMSSVLLFIATHRWRIQFIDHSGTVISVSEKFYRPLQCGARVCDTFLSVLQLYSSLSYCTATVCGTSISVLLLCPNPIFSRGIREANLFDTALQTAEKEMLSCYAVIETFYFVPTSPGPSQAY